METCCSVFFTTMCPNKRNFLLIVSIKIRNKTNDLKQSVHTYKFVITCRKLIPLLHSSVEVDFIIKILPIKLPRFQSLMSIYYLVRFVKSNELSLRDYEMQVHVLMQIKTWKNVDLWPQPINQHYSIKQDDH